MQAASARVPTASADQGTVLTWLTVAVQGADGGCLSVVISPQVCACRALSG